jgi:hypothetical protein
MRRSALVSAAFTILAAGAVAGAAPASAGNGAIVIRPDGCGFTPGSFPGVDVEIVGTNCLVVRTPGGPLTAHFTAQVPEGYTVAPGTYADGGPCRATVTPTGRINYVCHF